ncbi:MAG: cysteine desulfurase [Parcubacteria group bacterium]|nr:cysteine desulfurase [Parcubacteria group bacterium]
MRKKALYLDYASSTPVDPAVLVAMMPYLKQEYGNPSSLHGFGQKAAAALECSRQVAARFLGCGADEIIFTSGATEANNLAIQGVLRQTTKPHVITLAIEHESVLAPIQKLEKEGIAEATYISVSRAGIVNPEDIGKAIKENTVLVSVQYANSEIGTVQPIAEIGRIIRQKKKSSVVFHTDAVQAANFLDCNVETLGVDCLTLSAHKIYGPKGAGLLFVRKGVALNPLLEGGSQEGGLRSGTENIPAIVGMAKALAELIGPKTGVEAVRVKHMRDQLIRGVLGRVPESSCTGSLEQRLPNNAHFTFARVEGKDLVMLLDQKGIAVSSGSACSERSQEPSHVLLALGMSSKEAMGSLRITLGKRTTKEDIVRVLKTLPSLVDQLRRRIV